MASGSLAFFFAQTAEDPGISDLVSKAGPATRSWGAHAPGEDASYLRATVAPRLDRGTGSLSGGRPDPRHYGFVPSRGACFAPTAPHGQGLWQTRDHDGP